MASACDADPYVLMPRVHWHTCNADTNSPFAGSQLPTQHSVNWSLTIVVGPKQVVPQLPEPSCVPISCCCAAAPLYSSYATANIADPVKRHY